MSNYTPSTKAVEKVVLSALARTSDSQGKERTPEIDREEFHRWLASVKAGAWDEALTAYADSLWGGDGSPVPNPYREKEKT